MTRIGMLTPSSNTVLEPQSQCLVAALPEVSLHFARFRVTEIALDARALGQFDGSPMLAAAELLGHAKVDCITWNGTAAGWMGLDGDRALVAAIEATTGIRATTCVLTLFDLMRRAGLSRIGLVTPYTTDVRDRIVANFAREGVSIVAESGLDIRDNFTFGTVTGDTLDAQVAEVAAAGVDAVVVLCTNLAGAARVADWEARHGVPVLDSVAVSLLGALEATGVDPRPLLPHGRIFGW